VHDLHIPLEIASLTSGEVAWSNADIRRRPSCTPAAPSHSPTPPAQVTDSTAQYLHGVHLGACSNQLCHTVCLSVPGCLDQRCPAVAILSIQFSSWTARATCVNEQIVKRLCTPNRQLPDRISRSSMSGLPSPAANIRAVAPSYGISTPFNRLAHVPSCVSLLTYRRYLVVKVRISMPAQQQRSQIERSALRTHHQA